MRIDRLLRIYDERGESGKLRLVGVVEVEGDNLHGYLLLLHLRLLVLLGDSRLH
jgi:hypothetical protein